MASPPFNIAESVPGDQDRVLPFPGLERTLRAIVRDWLLWEHSNTGRHKFVVDTTAVRDSLVDWQTGSLMYNTTHGALQLRNGGAWQHNTFSSGTQVLFRNDLGPLGWTIQSDAFLEQATPRTITGGAVGSGGTHNFSTVFALARSISGTVGGHALTLGQIPLHSHTFSFGAQGRQLGGQIGVRTNTLATSGGSGLTDLQGGGNTHTHSWSGSANMDIRWLDFIVCARNAP